MNALLTEANVTTATLLVFMRFTAFFVTSPFPGPGSVPGTVRIVLAAGLSWALSSAVDAPPVSGPLWAAVSSEIILGLASGFLIALVVHGFAVAGEVAGHQMGLGTPSFIDPDLPAHLTVIGATFTFVALGVFVAGDGPARTLVFLERSVALVPPGSLSSLSGVTIAIEAGNDLFYAGIHVAAPLITAVFASQLLLAVLARTVPTLNLFVEGPALTLSAGLIGLIASLDTFVPLTERAFQSRFEEVARWLLS